MAFSAWECLQQEEGAEAIVHVTSSSITLDNTLKLSPASLTEVSGLPGVGKSLLCLQLAVNTAFSQNGQGMAANSIYIDTEGSIMYSRLHSLALARLHNANQSNSSMNIDTVFNSINYLRVQSPEELLQTIQDLDCILSTPPRLVKLVIVDSIAAPFRHMLDMGLRSRLLNGITQTLLKYARNYNLIVVVSNHMTVRHGGVDEVVPAFGDTLGYCFRQRFVIEGANGTRRRVVHWKGRDGERQKECEFQITSDGIRDCCSEAVQGQDLERYPAEPENKQMSQVRFQTPQQKPASEVSYATTENFYENDSFIDDDDTYSAVSSSSSINRFPRAPGQLTLMRKKKTVKLSPTGNFVIKHRVPEEVLANALFSRGEEFETMRYTAATCDPNDFASSGYNLRLTQYSRNIELFIVVTMYNEDHILFSRTMFALAQNIKYLCEKNEWGWDEDAWKKVAVVIVSDGRSKVHPNVLKVLTAMGVYQDGLAQAAINGSDVEAHIYEYTSQVAMDERHQFWGHNEGMPPIQTIFLLKEKNKKKINSHRWFLKALASVVEPRVVVLIDVGTKPERTALYNLWHTFFRNEQIAGACGEIRADLGSGIQYCKSLLNPLVASQNFEYKISNLLDKALESVFGYITVLPGAFSAYRYKALLDTGPGTGPMAKYFEGETQSDKVSDNSIFSANLYLAEDRILCFELVTKQNSNWTLHYVKNAYADTDVPDTVPEFLSQRRRWLNGSLFAGFYAIANIGRMWSSGHSFARKIVFTIQFMYNVFNQIFNWFIIGNFAITFSFLFEELKTILTASTGGTETTVRNKIINVIIGTANLSYPIVLVCLFVIAFGNRPQAFANVYRAVVIGFSLIGAVMMFLIVRRIVSMATTHTSGLATAYATTLGVYKFVNQTVIVPTVASGTVTSKDMAQLLVAQMISEMADVLDSQLQANLVTMNTMSYNYLITLGATIGSI
ncbi:Chitin synthase, class 2 [Nowakowskiella sp. JEL0078]|nr:Chitin synthase, class 2 [Nowakowskiella sp. JEL0078]